DTPWWNQNSGMIIAGNKLMRYDGNNSEIVIPDNVEIINPDINWNYNLEHVTIPGSVKRIEAETFYWCTNLQRVDILEGVRYIGALASRNCGLKEVVVPRSDSVIEPSAFDKYSTDKRMIMYGYKGTAAEKYA